MTEVQNDPDRVLHPLRRTRDGDVRAGLLGRGARRHRRAAARVIARARPQSVGWYMGNPGAFSYSHTLWVKGFLDALGSPHYYTASSQDVAQPLRRQRAALRLAARRPDPRPRAHELPADGRRQPARLARQRAHRAARPRAAARDRRARRPRRRRRPAPHGDRAALRARRRSARTPTPGCCSRCCDVLFEEGLADERCARARRPRRGRAGASAVARLPARGRPRRARGVAGRRRRARWPATSPPPTAPPSTAAPAPASAASARSSRSCSTLLNAVTGNLDRPGGAVFGLPADRARRDRRAAPGSTPTASARSRVGGFPDVLGAMPASLMPREIDDARASGQIRALFVSAGNPVLSVPGRRRARARARDARPAWSRSTSTSTRPTATPTTSCRRRRCSSATTCRSRSSASTRRRSSSTPDAVVPPRGEARQEWEIIEADRARDRRRALRASRAAARWRELGIRIDAAAAARRCCCAPARTATCSGCAAAGSALKWLRRAPARPRAAPRHPDGRAARASVRHPDGASASIRRRRCARARAPRRRPTATTPTSRCG